MLRSLIVLLLSFTVLLQSAQRTWIVASWKINQSYISSALCEKRMEENSCCAGSCYLNKQLKENETKEQSAPVHPKERIEYVTNLFHYTYACFLPGYTIAAEFHMVWAAGKTKSFNEPIFHPPSFIG